MYALHGLKHVCTKSLSFLLGILTACFVRTSQRPSAEPRTALQAPRLPQARRGRAEAHEPESWQSTGQSSATGASPCGESDFKLSGTRAGERRRETATPGRPGMKVSGRQAGRLPTARPGGREGAAHPDGVLSADQQVPDLRGVAGGPLGGPRPGTAPAVLHLPCEEMCWRKVVTGRHPDRDQGADGEVGPS